MPPQFGHSVASSETDFPQPCLQGLRSAIRCLTNVQENNWAQSKIFDLFPDIVDCAEENLTLTPIDLKIQL